MDKRIAAGVAAGAIVVGAAGAAILIPGFAAAADPSTSPAAATASTSPAATTAPGTDSGTFMDGHRGPGGPMGGPMGSDDITAAAKALGMSEADVTSALQSGKTLADLAKTQNVDVQTLIDAMVAAEKAEIQAQVDAGTITQAQADQRIANLTQHETDEVNGTFMDGHRGPGGPGGHHFGGHDGMPGQPPANSSNGSSNSTTPTATSDATSS